MRKDISATSAPDAATLKLALSALAKCDRPDCRESFIKKYDRHRFCSPTCKATMWKRAQKKA